MSQTIPARIVIRRDTAAAWTAANPVLLSGEWGFETDTRKLKIGNGSSAWNALSYYSTGGGGATILTGSGAPSSGTGANGDVYIDTTAWEIYGPKASGAWGTATSLVGPAGAAGAAGTNGANGTAATVAVGSVTTGAAGSSASVSNAGTSGAAVFNFTIPRGDTGSAGAQGPSGPAGAAGSNGTAATVSVGSVSTGAAGSSAVVTNAGTSSAAILNFTIPRGDAGAAGANGTNGTNGTAATVAVGSVSTGAAGSSAVVTNAGTSGAAVFNFTIPRGDTGATGATGATGPAGPVAGSSGQLVYNNGGTAAGASVGGGLTLSGGVLSASGGGGTKTYAVFTPNQNQPPSTAFATFDTRNSILKLDYDDTTSESGVFVGVLPEAASLGSGLIVRLWWMAKTATSGNVVWGVQFEKTGTDNDADSFDTAATGTSAANGTSGIETLASITITAIDSLAAGDRFRLKVYRDAANASDTMTGDAELVAVEVRSAA